MGHFLMMWFSDKPRKTVWLRIIAVWREKWKKKHCVETAVGKPSEGVTQVQSFKLVSFPKSLYNTS